MKITKISQQKRLSDRVNIFLDHEYSFSLTKNDLISLGLFKGQEVSKHELEKLLSTLKKSKCFSKALDYISRRQHSEKELATKLVRKDFGEFEINETFKKLRELNYLDDETFTKSFIEEKKSLGLKSKKEIFFQLKKKGISDTLLKKALDDYSEDEEYANAKILLRKKFKDSFERDKAYKYLSQKGFGYETVKQVLSEMGSI